MVTQITKVKNGMIPVPKKIKKIWEEAEVYIDVVGDTILIKRLTRPALTLKEMMDEFYYVARKTKLSKKTVERTLRNVRQKMSK